MELMEMSCRRPRRQYNLYSIRGARGGRRTTWSSCWGCGELLDLPDDFIKNPPRFDEPRSNIKRETTNYAAPRWKHTDERQSAADRHQLRKLGNMRADGVRWLAVPGRS
jgi:hypothetical protein